MSTALICRRWCSSRPVTARRDGRDSGVAAQGSGGPATPPRLCADLRAVERGTRSSPESQSKTHIASTSAQTSTSAKPFDTGIPHQAPAAFAGGLLGLGLWLMASPSVHGLVAESSHLRCCTSGRPSGLTLRHELPHRVSSSSSPPHGRTRRGRRVRPPVATIIDRRFASVPPRSVRTCRRCGRSTRGDETQVGERRPVARHRWIRDRQVV